ncbi:hypothetical protein KGM_213863 [Danaus plexippus plexippus]|uniref:Uncharacterized protein n=1 Tax=Danaus plexippus plexippus TaxID=278856 RepID=A0A212F511_DANPL|nr:hypothetical protein KGM_213863 [Danaus plexippus plexippus]
MDARMKGVEDGRGGSETCCFLPSHQQPSSATKLPEFVRQDTCEDGEKPVVSSAEDPADTCHNLSTASTLPTELLANRTADLPTLAQTRRSFLDIAERGARTTSLPDSIRK